MLDTSTNPLIALYFACRSSRDIVGEVIRVTLSRGNVKYYDSDTVACLANLALLDDEVRQNIDTGLDRDAFNKTNPSSSSSTSSRRRNPIFATR